MIKHNFLKRSFIFDKSCLLKWVFISLISMLVLVNYMDRSILSFAFVPITHKLSINHLQFGALFSTFFLAAILGNFISAFLVRFIPSRYLWMFAAMLWSGALYLQTCVTTYHHFQILRFIMGLGEGFVFPLISSVSAKTTRKSALLTSIMLVGVPLSSCISSPIFSFLINVKGWVSCFHIMAWVGLCLGVSFVLLPRAVTSGYDDNTPNDRASLVAYLSDFKLAIFNLNMLAAYSAAFASGCVIMFCLIWLPEYLHSQLSLNINSSVCFEVLPWGLSLIGLLTGGYMFDRYLKNQLNPSARYLHILSSALLLSAVCLLLLFFTKSEFVCVSLVTLAIVSVMSVNSALIMLIVEHSNRPEVGTSIMAVFFLLSCLVAGPLTGWVVDLTGHYYMAFLANSLLLFASCVLIYTVKSIDK